MALNWGNMKKPSLTKIEQRVSAIIAAGALTMVGAPLTTSTLNAQTSGGAGGGAAAGGAASGSATTVPTGGANSGGSASVPDPNTSGGTTMTPGTAPATGQNGSNAQATGQVPASPTTTGSVPVGAGENTSQPSTIVPNPNGVSVDPNGQIITGGTPTPTTTPPQVISGAEVPIFDNGLDAAATETTASAGTVGNDEESDRSLTRDEEELGDTSGAVDIGNGVQPGDLAPSTGSATTVVDALKSNPKFSMLVKLLGMSQLDSILMGAKDVTVFAPTNAAFKTLTDEQRRMLTDPANSQKLSEVLLFHVVQGNITAENLQSPGELSSVQGTALEVEQRKASDETEVVIGNLAKVTSVNLMAGNGYIHAIDRVLMPELSQPEVGSQTAVTDAATYEAAKAAVEAKKTQQEQTEAAAEATATATPAVELK